MTATAMICMDLHGLTPEQNHAVAIKIKRNCAWSKVAAEMQIAESTIYRWRQANPRIDELVLQAERENVHAAREKLSASLDDALEALRLIARDPAVEPRDRIAASKALLDLASKGDSGAKRADSNDAGAREHAAEQRAGPGLPADVIDAECDDGPSEAELEAELARELEGPRVATG